MPRQSNIDPKAPIKSTKASNLRASRHIVTDLLVENQKASHYELGPITPSREGLMVAPIPSVYADLQRIDTTNPVSREKIYNQLSRLTPYLVQRLIYESANQDNRASDRVRAAEILLNKIMPNLSAEQLEVNSSDLQSLVIVRSASDHKAQPPTPPAPDPETQE